jgi:hypothetical protein
MVFLTSEMPMTLDLRPQNLLLTFESRAITVQELLVAEKSEDRYKDPKEGLAHEDPNGIWVIYSSRPVNVVADEEPVDLKKMVVKIADFGKGNTFCDWLICSDLY